MSRNYDYITRNFLDYSYNQNSYKPTGIDLLRQAGTFKKLMSQEKQKNIMLQQCLLLLKNCKKIF